MRIYLMLYLDRIKSVYRFVLFFKRIPNLISPKRFTDFLLLKRIKWGPRSSFEIETADKYLLRSYVKNKLGDAYLPQFFGAFNSGSDIDFEKLNYPCVIKSNHGSGHVEILKSCPENKKDLVNKLNKWLSQEFPHWYRFINPKLICEEYLVDDKKDQPLEDFKFFVFNGAATFIEVDVDRFNGHKRSMYTRDWDLIEVIYNYPIGPKIEKPLHLEKMIKIAEALSNKKDFVRVDLYSSGEKIIVGELTHSPDAARMPFNPDSFDFEMYAK